MNRKNKLALLLIVILINTHVIYSYGEEDIPDNQILVEVSEQQNEVLIEEKSENIEIEEESSDIMDALAEDDVIDDMDISDDTELICLDELSAFEASGVEECEEEDHIYSTVGYTDMNRNSLASNESLPCMYYEIQKCDVCGHEQSIEIIAHDPERIYVYDDVETSDSDSIPCEAVYYEVEKCRVCGEELDERISGYMNHRIIGSVSYYDPESGIEIKKCENQTSSVCEEVFTCEICGEVRREVNLHKPTNERFIYKTKSGEKSVTDISDVPCGKYVYKYYCTGCNDTITEELEIEHDYDYEKPVYIWSKDNKSVTAQMVCSRDASHVDSDTIEKVSTKSTTTKSGCETIYLYTTNEFEDDNYSVQKKEIKKISHGDLKKIPSTPATCTNPGNSEYYLCETCNKLFSDSEGKTETSLEEVGLPALGHNWEKEGKITKKPICTESGVRTYKCLNGCEEIITKTIDKLGHDWDEWVVKKPATCSSKGLKIRTCKNDSTHTEEKEIEINSSAHKLEKVEKIDPTCETAGNIEYYYCVNENCGKLFFDADGKTEIKESETELSALGHEWDEGEITVNPTCEKDGVRTFTCSHNSKHTKTESIPASGHKWGDWAETKPATCSSMGEETRICQNDNNHTDTRKTDINRSAHKMGKWKTIIAATEDVEGLEERVCELDSSHKETRTIPRIGHVHTLEKIEETSATCEKEGNIEYWICTECNHLFGDSEGNQEIEKEDTILPALKHTWDDGKITAQPSCEKEGVITYTCKNDSTHTRTESIAATGHKWGDWVTTKEATESEEGIETRTCQNDSSHVETRTVKKLIHQHSMKKTDRIAAGCETDGHIEYWTCETCGKLYKDIDGLYEIRQEDTILPSLGHEWNEGDVVIPATCEDPGTIKYTCKRDDSHTKEETLPALGHLWGEWLISEEPTEEADGSKYRVCKNDNSHTETAVIPKLVHEHELEKTESLQPSCEDNGNLEYWQCKTCGKLFGDPEGKEEIQKEDVIISPLGHDWNQGEMTKYASADSNGLITYTCSRCDKEKTEEFEIIYKEPQIEEKSYDSSYESLKTPILEQEGYSESDIVYYEITLPVSVDNGADYEDLTAETASGKTFQIQIPYPSGTNAEDYDFWVTHMLSNGTVEDLPVTEAADYLIVSVSSFSPYAVGYKRTDDDNSEEDRKDDPDDTLQKDTDPKQKGDQKKPQTVKSENNSFSYSTSAIENDGKVNPETGDDSGTIRFYAELLISALVMIFFWRKKCVTE